MYCGDLRLLYNYSRLIVIMIEDDQSDFVALRLMTFDHQPSLGSVQCRQGDINSL